MASKRVLACRAKLSISLTYKEISRGALSLVISCWAAAVVIGCWGSPHARSAADVDASDKRYALGADYYGKGLVEPAIEELLKALELNPANADANNLMGIIH